MRRHPGWALAGLVVLATVPLAVIAHGRVRDARASDEARAPTVPQSNRPGYATSDRCEACHPSQYHSWHQGYHRTMTQYASPESVRGDFSVGRVTGGGYDVQLSRSGDDFFADMTDPLYQYMVDTGQQAPLADPPHAPHRISLVTGSHHMQAFWVSSGIDNAQMSLPFTYLFDDKRWVPRGEVFLHPPDERHPIQVWNVSCIRCHSTGGQPLTRQQPIATRVAEIGIACEQCHGAAEAHIAANQNPLARYQHHLAGGDATIVNPAKLDRTRGSQVCGQCHSLTEVSPDIELNTGKTFAPGDDLEKTQPLLRPLQPTDALRRHLAEDALYLKNYFWSDGTIRVSSRDYSGLVESKCKSGCMDCHSLHDADPNMLVKDQTCATCHPHEDHGHHKSVQCVDCHMPHTVYGLLKGIRSHRIDSPRVVAEQRGDTRPNACNLCHLDKSLAWTAQQLNAWYKQPIADNLPTTPVGPQWLLAGDAVLRAITAWHADKSMLPYLAAALHDPYAAVRYVAGHAVQRLVPGFQYDYLAPTSTLPIAPDAQQWIDKRDDTPVQAME